MGAAPDIRGTVISDLKKIRSWIRKIVTSHPALEGKFIRENDLTPGKVFLAFLSALRYESRYAVQVGLALELLDLAVACHYPGMFASEAEKKGFPENIDIITGDYFYSKALEAVGELRDPEIVRVLAKAIEDISEGISKYSRIKVCSADELISELERLSALYRAAAAIAFHLSFGDSKDSEETGDMLKKLATAYGSLNLIKKRTKGREKTGAENFAESYFLKVISEAEKALREKGVTLRFHDFTI